LENLHTHARLVAHIAARLPVPKRLLDITVVAGMLHDVGKLILAWKLPERFQKLQEQAAEEHSPLYKVEEREYGFSHAEIGAYLLGLWGLPYIMVEAVALHHAPNRVPHECFDAVSAVHVANLLARELEPLSPGATLGSYTPANPEELTEVSTEGDLAAWRAMAAEIPPLLAEA
jgi:HD-like signal output (HDOD) protein